MEAEWLRQQMLPGYQFQEIVSQQELVQLEKHSPGSRKLDKLQCSRQDVVLFGNWQWIGQQAIEELLLLGKVLRGYGAGHSRGRSIVESEQINF